MRKLLLILLIIIIIIIITSLISLIIINLNEKFVSNEIISCNNLPNKNSSNLLNECFYMNSKYAMCNQNLIDFFDIKPDAKLYNSIKKYHVYNDLYSGAPAFDINTLPNKYFKKIINDRLKLYNDEYISIFIGKSPLGLIPDIKNIPKDVWHIYHTGLYLVPYSQKNYFNINNYEHLITTMELWGIGSILNGININIENNKYEYNFPFKGLIQVPYLFGCSNNTFFLKPQDYNNEQVGYNTHLEYLITVKKDVIFKLRKHLIRWTNSNNKYILPSFLEKYDCVNVNDFNNRNKKLNYDLCRICDTFCMTSIKYICKYLYIDIPCNILNIKFNDLQFIYEELTIIDNQNIKKYLTEIKFQNKIVEDIINLFKKDYNVDLTKFRNTHQNSHMYILIKYIIDNKLLKSPHIYLTFNHNNKASLGRFKLVFPYIKIIYNSCSFNEFLLNYN